MTMSRLFLNCPHHARFVTSRVALYLAQKKALRSIRTVADVMLCMTVTYLVLTTVSMQFFGGQFEHLVNGGGVRNARHGRLRQCLSHSDCATSFRLGRCPGFGRFPPTTLATSRSSSSTPSLWPLTFCGRCSRRAADAQMRSTGTNACGARDNVSSLPP